ncbi:MAG: TetR/AcrR family transcriptional regulator C-terminal domain-containing protein [Chloroflexota bacterium]
MPKHRKDLTTEKIIQKAIELADKSGLEPLTMRSLAKALGATPMSLYRYVANREDMLDKMVDVVFSEIQLPIIGNDWRSEMRKRAISTRSALLSHRWALGLLDSRLQPGPATQKHHNAVIGTLRESGFSIPLTTQTMTLLDAYIYGFILQELSLPLSESGNFDEVGESIVHHLDQATYPYLAELATAHLDNAGFDFNNFFEVGLDIVLEGLEVMAESKQP